MARLKAHTASLTLTRAERTELLRYANAVPSDIDEQIATALTVGRHDDWVRNEPMAELCRAFERVERAVSHRRGQLPVAIRPEWEPTPVCIFSLHGGWIIPRGAADAVADVRAWASDEPCGWHGGSATRWLHIVDDTDPFAPK